MTFSSGELTVAQTVERGVTVVALQGVIDIDSVDRLSQAIEEAMGADRAIIVDLSAIEALDSTGLRVLLDARSALVQRDAALGVVCDEQGAIARMLQVAGAGRFLSIFPTRAAALDEIAGSP